jgi:sulfur carrier protein
LASNVSTRYRIDAGFLLLWFDSSTIMVPIFVNGDPQSVQAEATVADLLARLKMNPRFLAVELNRQVVPRAEHARTKLAADDQLEIVTLVGGG